MMPRIWRSNSTTATRPELGITLASVTSSCAHDREWQGVRRYYVRRRCVRPVAVDATGYGELTVEIQFSRLLRQFLYIPCSASRSETGRSRSRSARTSLFATHPVRDRLQRVPTVFLCCPVLSVPKLLRSLNLCYIRPDRCELGLVRRLWVRVQARGSELASSSANMAKVVRDHRDPCRWCLTMGEPEGRPRSVFVISSASIEGDLALPPQPRARYTWTAGATNGCANLKLPSLRDRAPWIPN